MAEVPANPLQVALPPDTGILPLPAQPGIPPSVEDVMAAMQYKDEALIGFQDEVISAEGLANAMEYKLKILQARGGVDAAPAWFAPAMHQILQPINTRLDALDTRLNTLEGHVIEVHRYTAVNNNSRCGNGSMRKYVVVPFRDGTDPRMPPHSLPFLESQAIVESLPAARTTAYHVGYYGDNGPARTNERKKKIMVAIRGYRNS